MCVESRVEVCPSDGQTDLFSRRPPPLSARCVDDADDLEHSLNCISQHVEKSTGMHRCLLDVTVCLFLSCSSSSGSLHYQEC